MLRPEAAKKSGKYMDNGHDGVRDHVNTLFFIRLSLGM